MKRLMTKHWKVTAYLVGLMGIAFTRNETIGMTYTGIGMTWFVCWLLWTSMVAHSIAMGMPRDDTSLKAVVIWNRRLLAYLVGLIPVGLVGSEILTGLYLGFGLVWVASWSWKNRHLGGEAMADTDDDRSPQPFGRDYGTLSSSDATVIYGSSHFG